MDFFDPTDRRYEYRRKDEQENTTARHSPQSGCEDFEFGFALFEAFDTPVSAASQNTNPNSKSSQSIVEFSAVHRQLRGGMSGKQKTVCCDRGDSGENKCRRGTQQTVNKLIYIIQPSIDFC